MKCIKYKGRLQKLKGKTLVEAAEIPLKRNRLLGLIKYERLNRITKR